MVVYIAIFVHRQPWGFDGSVIKKALRELDKLEGISHSDNPCIVEGGNVALFNSVTSPLFLDRQKRVLLLP